MDIITRVFGEVKDLNAIQMCCRSVVMFVITLVLIRIAGVKTFGKTSAFDNIIVIMLGAILSRGVVGVSPFFDVALAGLAMVLMTRLFSWLAIKNKSFERLIKGSCLSIYKDGKMNEKNLKQSSLSEADLMEAVRKELHTTSLESIEEVFIETSGELSVIKKKE